MSGKYDKFDYDEARRELWSAGMDPSELSDTNPVRRDDFLKKTGLDPDIFKSSTSSQTSSFSPTFDVSDEEMGAGVLALFLIGIILYPFILLSQWLGVSIPVVFLLIFIYLVWRYSLKEEQRFYFDLLVFILCLARYAFLHA